MPSGQNLVDRVEQYEKEEMAALTREQQLHVEAAARQLETLARLEQHHISPTSFQAALDESYFPKPQAPADAGAGAGIRHRYVPPLQQRTVLDASPHREVGRMPDLAESPSDDDPLLPFATSSGQDSPNRMASTQLTHHTPPFSHGASTGLSTELRRILNLSTLNLSTLDPDVSVMASALGIGGGASIPMSEHHTDTGDLRAERQYLWLERYHAAAASAQLQQQRHTAASESQRVEVPTVQPPEESSEPDHAFFASVV